MDDPELMDSVHLVHNAQDGDLAAFNELAKRYYERVRKVVRLRMSPGLRKHYDSVDIVQDTFVRAIDNFDHFEVRSETSLINWLAKIAENLVKTRATKRSVQQERAYESVASSMENGALRPQPADEMDPPVDLIAKQEFQHILEECIRELPEPQREVIIVRNFATGGGPRRYPAWETVAREIGSPSGDAARMLHTRALEDLAKLLKRRMKDD